MSVPGVVLLGSVREEDVTLIAERARAAEIRADPDDELAERLWRELREAEKTNWAGWREPWKMSDGLLLEYVHILTRGQRKIGRASCRERVCPYVEISGFAVY